MKCKSKNSNKCNIFANLFYWQRYWERMLGKKSVSFSIWYAINSGMAENTIDQNGNLRKNAAWKTVNSFSARIHFIWKITTFLFFFMQNACSLLLYMEIENTIQQVANRIVNFIEMKNSFLFACTLTKTWRWIYTTESRKKMLNNKN